MDSEQAQATDKVEATVVRGKGQSVGVATTGAPLPTSGSPASARRKEEEPPEGGGVYESAGEEDGRDPNVPREQDQEAPAISMTNPPPREPPTLSGAKVSASRLYMLLHNATNRASIDEHDIRTAWDDLKHHMGGVV